MAQVPYKLGRFFRPSPVALTGLQTELSNLYASSCPKCGGTKHKLHLPNLSDLSSVFDDWTKQVYELKGKGQKISRDVYFHNAEQLSEALMKGLGNIGRYDAPTNLLKAKLENNIYAFSAAKSITEYKLMAAQLTDENGKLRTFNMFREQVEKINPLFNEQYLKAEYSNAVAQAEAAVEWERFVAESEAFPFLIYKTQEDDRVRDDHAILNNIKRRVDDPWWSTYRPPNGWGPCRCYLIQDDNEHGLTPDKEAWSKGKTANIAPMFKNNPGESSAIYTDEHPYFKTLDGKVQELDAIKNYGMKNWKQVRKDARDYAAMSLEPQTKEQFKQWWNDMVKANGVDGENFALTDIKGNKILFDADTQSRNEQYTREHIVNREHYKYGRLAESSITKPDEMWSFYDTSIKSNPLTMSYIKYYKDKTIVTIVREDKGMLRVVTSYELVEEKTFNNLRKGVLHHANKKF